MAKLSQLPETVRQEIEDLPRHYRIQHQAVRDRVLLTARVRGVPIVITLDAGSYPFAPPELELASGWSWEAASSGRIHRLESLTRWNRTLGLAVLLRELKQRFRDKPPVRSRRARVRRWPILRMLARWLRKLRERLRWRRRRPELAAATAGPDALREIYDKMIRDNTTRVHRYQQAVAELVTQWRRKAGRLEALHAEIRDLKKREGTALKEAGQIVDKLRAAGESTEKIRADADYRRVRATYEECATELSEAEEQAEKLEADAEKHLGKIERHEAQLEQLMGELEDLKNEATEVVTDMTLVQLEKEIVDVRAGVAHASAAEELRQIRQQLRKERAIVRVTREATESGDTDELYLEVAEKVSAARELEQSLGMGQTPPRDLEPER